MSSGGNITRRGKNSWRLKYEGERDAAGRRRTLFATIRGTRKQAQAEPIRRLAEVANGTLSIRKRSRSPSI